MLKTKEYQMDEERNQEHWRMVSRIFDRVMMIVFILFTILLIIYNLIDLTIMYREERDADIKPLT